MISHSFHNSYFTDISNVAKPVNLRKWSDLVFEEFLTQGDKEKELGMAVSPYFDRTNTDQVRLSLNFIDFMVGPMFVAFANSFPSLQVCSDEVKRSREYWAKMAPEEPLLPKVSDKEVQELIAKRKKHAADKRSEAQIAADIPPLRRTSSIAVFLDTKKPQPIKKVTVRPTTTTVHIAEYNMAFPRGTTAPLHQTHHSNPRKFTLQFNGSYWRFNGSHKEPKGISNTISISSHKIE
jgi:hypothetical protein